MYITVQMLCTIHVRKVGMHSSPIHPGDEWNMESAPDKPGLLAQTCAQY
jgi:hypothetical protein